MRIFCVSGFLGLPEDWNFLENSGISFSAHGAEDFLAPDFWQAADKINLRAEKEDCDILVGYSLGGRLAMHCLLQNSERWKAAIIISAHPGLISSEEKAQRLESDKEWAQRFLESPWGDVLSQWNHQAVFGGSEVVRSEKDFNRKNLAELLKNFSLGQQTDLRNGLAVLNVPVTFVTGRRDEKFTNLSQTLAGLNSRFQHVVLECGHRVLQEAPGELLKVFPKPIASAEISV